MSKHLHTRPALWPALIDLGGLLATLAAIVAIMGLCLHALAGQLSSEQLASAYNQGMQDGYQLCHAEQEEVAQ